MTDLKFEIVEVNGKKWMEIDNTVENKRLTKEFVLCFGGARYLHNGKIIYRAIGAYGNLREWYSALIGKAERTV